MNSKNKILIISFLIFLIGCKPVIKITCEQNKNLPIVIRLANNKEYRLSSIEIPLKLKINNRSNYKISFAKIYYNYADTKTRDRRGLGLSLYKFNKKLKKIRNKKTEIESRNELNYICYTSHYPDSLVSSIFYKDIEKMYLEKKDTLHIGTISEFKIKHKKLFDKLTKNDSISIQFLENRRLGERVTIPVQW